MIDKFKDRYCIKIYSTLMEANFAAFLTGRFEKLHQPLRNVANLKRQFIFLEH